MNRPYNSSLRQQAAAETRRRILQAALKLHWQGITEYEPLAQEAGCSVATVRKYFPTKESLFRDCTRTFSETLVMPDLNALAAICDPRTRAEASVAELCRMHESMLGYAWLAAHARKHSPTLDAEMQAYEGLADAITGMIAAKPSTGVLRGLLDFLTWRALRLSGGLSADDARQHLISLVLPLVAGEIPSPHESETE